MIWSTASFVIGMVVGGTIGLILAGLLGGARLRANVLRHDREVED